MTASELTGDLFIIKSLQKENNDSHTPGYAPQDEVDKNDIKPFRKQAVDIGRRIATQLRTWIGEHSKAVQ